MTLRPNEPGPRSRPLCGWPACVLAAATVLSAATGTAWAEAPQSPARAPVQPPADNAFPVPLPYRVSFVDDWHACREGCRRQHQGNDLMADEGSPVVAVEAGVVVGVDNSDDGPGGISLWLQGNSGVAYYYGHNSENLVVKGQHVPRGRVIGLVGRTGNARTTPPHVHFQLNLCGEMSSDEPCTVDPYPYLQSWARGRSDSGADGVGWYEASTATFGRRSGAGEPLASLALGGAGAAGVLPVAGDWDGDGADSPGIYQRADATFRLWDDAGLELAPVALGTPGRSDAWPIAGDFDGDGRDTVGLYYQGDAAFVALLARGVPSPPLAAGTPGEPDALPVAGDWDGDGRDSVGLYHQGDGSLHLIDDERVALTPATLGAAGDVAAFPVAGDWDGDGRDAVGLMRRDAGSFDLPATDGLDRSAVRTIAVEGGGADLLPVAGDWNGGDLVTLDELRQIYGVLPAEAKVVEGLPDLNQAMRWAGIVTPERKAAFLATLRSESAFQFDAVEVGNASRYRGRGLIQITGEANYRAAGGFLGLDLVGNPDLAIDPTASAAIAAWYWSVAHDINAAADRLDMGAVNLAIGFQPSPQRDARRCADFLAALHYYYRGGPPPEAVNCSRPADRAAP